MWKIKKTIELWSKIIAEAKKQVKQEREEKLLERAKELIEELNESKKTVRLLERQVNNFIKECNLDG